MRVSTVNRLNSGAPSVLLGDGDAATERPAASDIPGALVTGKQMIHQATA